jgi:glycosyltransferase involved in cell wall biosynthesis
MLAELPAIVSDLPALIDIINENANALGISTGLILKDDENVDEVVDVLCEIIDNKEFYKERIRQVKRNYTYEANEEVIKKILC